MTVFNLRMALSIVCISCCTVFSGISQPLAPTLSAGLTAVTGQRGDLDVALLSEIISEKQEEVKREILERKILTSLDGQSFAMQNFVYSSFYALLSYKDKNAIEKELLTQVSVLALQAGLAEAILHFSYREGMTVSTTLTDAIKEYILFNYDVEVDQVDGYYDALEIRLQETKFSLLFSIEDEIDRIVPEEKKNKKMGFGSILVDAVYESTRRNPRLQELGFVKLHPNLESQYETLNMFLGTRNSIPSPLEELTDGVLTLLVDYHPLFYDLINDYGITINEINGLGPSSLSDAVVTAEINAIAGYLDVVSAGMSIRLANNSISEELIEEQTLKLNEIRSGISDFWSRNQGMGGVAFNVNDYQFVTRNVIPYANEMLSLGILNNSQLTNIDEMKQYIFHYLVDEVANTLSNTADMNGVGNLEIQKFGGLIRIIASLSRLDDVKSYEYLFNSLAQVGVNSLENTEVKFLRDILYYVEAYTSVDRDSNRLHVNVESLLLKILTLYENRASGDLQLYFGAGLGQTYKTDYADGQELIGADSMHINSLSFASEKIGLKLKLINNKRIQSKHKEELWALPALLRNKSTRPATPIISDLYFFGFGSGLLYNVANLTTEGENFDNAMVGIGVGVAFFNALDVNVWRVSPMVRGDSFSQSWKNRQFFGFSFDIKLTEYLSAVGEKRRVAKATKDEQ